MADDGAPIQDSGSKQKMFSKKGLIVFVLTIVLYTITLFYLMMDDKSLVDKQGVGGDTTKFLEIRKELLRQQNSLPDFILEEFVVPIRLDKSGETSKNLYVGFTFRLGLTKSEEDALDKPIWPPPTPDVSKFQETFDYKKHGSEADWSLVMEVLGTGGVEKPMDDKESYLKILTNMKSEIKSRALQILRATTFSNINTQDGATRIEEDLKQEVNEKLHNIGKYKRVNKVKITAFHFSN